MDNKTLGATLTLEHAPLSQRIVNYPQCAPQDSIVLVNTDYSVLKELPATPEEIQAVLNYRRELIDVAHSYERKPINSAEVVLEMLSAKRPLLRPAARKWLFYVLNERRERRLVPRGDDMVYQTVLTRTVPSVQYLKEKAPLPKGGVYLGLYGGSPNILSVSTVAEEVCALQKDLPVADILFWQLEKGEAPALFSLAKGQGDKGGKPVPFPSPTYLEKATYTP